MSIFINQPHGWIFLVLLAASIASVVWFYRRVPPTVGPGLRLTLAILRSAAFALLFLALIEPVIALTRVISERPVIAVLLDGSRSMAIADGTGGAQRGDEALTLLNEIVLPRIAREGEIHAYAFSSGLAPLDVERGTIDGPAPKDGESTDIAEAFAALGREFSGRNLGAVVIASDGANNRGVSPHEAALALDVPVYVLGVGRSEPQADIAVREVVTNRISYAGEVLPIQVRVSSAGYGGSETTLELSEDGELLDSSPIRLSDTGEEIEVTFKVVPATPGVHRYTISVPQAPGELTTTNNVRVVATNAVKGKIRVLLVATRPSWDFAFIRREFEADENVDLTTVVVKTGAVVPHGRGLPSSREELFTYDLVVLVEPSWGRPLVAAEWLAGFVRERGGGLLMVGLPDRAPPEPFSEALPVVTGGRRTSTREVRVELTESGESEPTTRVVSDRRTNAEIWRSLPPVWTGERPWWSARADARTLAVGRGPAGDEIPVVVAWRAGAGNAMVVAAEGIWRWKLAGPVDVDVYDRFLANAARWLTARGELERVVVTTDKDVYAAGEAVHLSAQVYREDFRLAGDAEVTIEIARGEGAAPVASIVLTPEGDFYRGRLGPLEPGRYLVNATAVRGGEEVGTADGEFTIEEFSLEDSEVRKRPAFLRRLAEDSGGVYLSPETADEMPETIDLDWTQRISSREFEVWNSPWLLLGFVGLLSVEWTLRRRKGLP